MKDRKQKQQTKQILRKQRQCRKQKQKYSLGEKVKIRKSLSKKIGSSVQKIEHIKIGVPQYQNRRRKE